MMLDSVVFLEASQQTTPSVCVRSGTFVRSDQAANFLQNWGALASPIRASDDGSARRGAVVRRARPFSYHGGWPSGSAARQ